MNINTNANFDNMKYNLQYSKNKIQNLKVKRWIAVGLIVLGFVIMALSQIFIKTSHGFDVWTNCKNSQ